VKIIFSKIFEKEVSKEMGLQLEIFASFPFLYRGFISANFNLVGNVPVYIIKLQVKVDKICGILCFKIFMEIPY